MINLWVLNNGFVTNQNSRPFVSDKLSSFAYLIVTNPLFEYRYQTIQKDHVDKQAINLFFISVDKKYKDIKETSWSVLKHYKEQIEWCLDNNIVVVIERLWELDPFDEQDYQSCKDSGIPIDSPNLVFLYPGCIELDRLKSLCSSRISNKIFSYYYFIYFFRRMYELYFDNNYFNFNIDSQSIVYDYSFVLGRVKNDARETYLKKYNEYKNNSIIYYYLNNVFFDIADNDKRFTDNVSYFKKALVWDKAIPISFYQSKFNVHCETHIDVQKRFVTEKSMKIMVPLRPAAIIGSIDHNKNLKEKLGFELYEEIFDYSLLDVRDRMPNAFEHLNEISKLPNSFFDQHSIKEKCIYNKQHFLDISSNEHFYKTSMDLIETWIK